MNFKTVEECGDAFFAIINVANKGYNESFDKFWSGGSE